MSWSMQRIGRQAENLTPLSAGPQSDLYGADFALFIGASKTPADGIKANEKTPRSSVGP